MHILFGYIKNKLYLCRMVDETIKIILREKKSELNFRVLLSFMEATGIEFRDRILRGPMGIATYYCIYLDMTKIITYHEKMLFFVILHEIAHFKRIAKVGREHVIRMLSIEEFKPFCDHIINEEIIADRYACYVYQCLNQDEFPRTATQELHLDYRQREYERTAQHLFGVIKNNEENYKKLLESFVL